jgi:hypothetical protein
MVKWEPTTSLQVLNFDFNSEVACRHMEALLRAIPPDRGHNKPPVESVRVINITPESKPSCSGLIYKIRDYFMRYMEDQAHRKLREPILTWRISIVCFTRSHGTVYDSDFVAKILHKTMKKFDIEECVVFKTLLNSIPDSRYVGYQPDEFYIVSKNGYMEFDVNNLLHKSLLELKTIFIEAGTTISRL